jgi:hypothetical protein
MKKLLVIPVFAALGLSGLAWGTFSIDPSLLADVRGLVKAQRQQKASSEQPQSAVPSAPGASTPANPEPNGEPAQFGPALTAKALREEMDEALAEWSRAWSAVQQAKTHIEAVKQAMQATAEREAPKAAAMSEATRREYIQSGGVVLVGHQTKAFQPKIVLSIGEYSRRDFLAAVIPAAYRVAPSGTGPFFGKVVVDADAGARTWLEWLEYAGKQTKTDFSVLTKNSVVAFSAPQTPNMSSEQLAARDTGI